MSDAARAWTVLDLLRWTADFFAKRGIDSARLDAELLLASALGSDRLRLYLDFEKPVHAEERARFRELVRRRAEERVPVAQLVGRKEFWSLPLRVTPDVLVPRPETETLVELALQRFPERDGELRVLDLGTGSGALALALASERPKARVLATDVSAAALAVAAGNARELGLDDRVRFAEGSWGEAAAGERFDLVVSNPPYLPASRPDAERPPELAHEPQGALLAGPDGLDAYRALAPALPDLLAAEGVVLLEIDPAGADAVPDLLRAAGLSALRVHPDLAGRARVVEARPAGGMG